jgi:TatD DNase family protein
VIDTHAHLDALEEPGAAIERARQAGVTRIVSVGTGIDSCRAVLAIAEVHGDVFAALGIDPHHAANGEAARIDELRELLSHGKAVAVGETGLDYHYGLDNRAEQRRLFDAQLGLAQDLRLPVVIHSRAANVDTEAFLRRHEGTVVMHCFSEPGLLQAGVERGWYFSFAGNVTYPAAEELRAAAASVESDRILAETDAPNLAPQPVRGRRNEPAFVRHTVEVLAAVRHEDPAELAASIDANATAAFGL